MIGLFKALWKDELGAIITAEAAFLATLGVIGATVGIGAAAKSIDAELREVAYAFRSLDQSYYVHGSSTPLAAKAGSGYIQQPVKRSLWELKQFERRLEREGHEEARRKEREEREKREREMRKRRPFKRPPFKRPPFRRKSDKNDDDEVSAKKTAE